MKHIAWLGAVALAAIAFAMPALADPPACGLLLAASLEMGTEPDGQVAVPVTINDRAARLVVDTGSIYSSISSELADELGLKRRLGARGYELLGNVPLYDVVSPNSFRIGNLSTDSIGFYVVPAQALHIDSDGLLGPDIMSKYDVEFDFAHARFNIFSQDHCPGQVVYWTREPYAHVAIQVDDNWHISVPVTLDGRQIQAVVDTGASRSTMSLDVAKSVLGIDESNPALKKLEPVSVNGRPPVALYHYPFQTLALDGVQVHNPLIDILPAETFGKDAPQLILGLDTLRQLHLYIAYKEQVLYATAAEAAPFVAATPPAKSP
jgi:predicted aspartyl protease